MRSIVLIGHSPLASVTSLRTPAALHALVQVGRLLVRLRAELAPQALGEAPIEPERLRALAESRKEYRIAPTNLARRS
jgi:hypothetical protein